MKKIMKKICFFILIPILVFVFSGGGFYFYLQTKLKTVGDTSKTKVVNALVKEMVTHPKEVKEMINSVTIADLDASTSSDSKEISKDIANKSENISTGTSSSVNKNETTSSVPPLDTPVKSGTTSDSSSIFSLEYMKTHYTEYELLSTGAKNIEGNIYRLTATVRHKATGKINTVEVTTQLSESMKETLRSHRK